MAPAAPHPTDDITGFETVLATLGLPTETLAADRTGTLRPPRPGQDGSPLPRSLDATVLAALPRLALDGRQGRGAELDLGDTIGQGGMGLVRLARQVPLAREVAVKSVRPERVAPDTTLALLREAWVTGGLEHPNVVPVHTLGTDGDGAPLLVMKRIEGTVWTDLLRGRTVEAQQSMVDPLGRHLDVLLQVCNAVAFAHSRGIVHRDLKPDNVMVGRFGEVYVLDWGLAVTVRDGEDDRIPRAMDIRTIAGTPQYMAPEMIAIDFRRIDTRCDVYLLGGILHEILTGRPPHQGDSLVEVLRSAYRSAPPQLPADVPAELADLCRRALAAQPEDRPVDAAFFRRELVRYIHHRHSLEVAAAARQRLRELQDLLAAEAPDAAQVSRVFSECRFGLQLALTDWPGNAPAREDLRAVLGLMARHECDRGELHAAEQLAAELDRPDPELTERLAALRTERERKAAEIKELQRLELEMDLRVGAKTRSLYAALIGVLYAAVPLLIGTGSRLGWFQWSHWTNLIVALDYTTVLLVGVWLARETMGKTEVNRRYVRALFSLAGFFWVLALAGWLLALTPQQVFTIDLAALFLFLLVLAATIDRRLGAAALVYLLAFWAGATWPQQLPEAAAAGNFLACMVVSWVWRPAAGWIDARKVPPGG